MSPPPEDDTPASPAPPPEASLRKIIHDLNNELFLIRGYADFTVGLVDGNEVASNNLKKILERLDAIEALGQELRQKQIELEP